MKHLTRHSLLMASLFLLFSACNHQTKEVPMDQLIETSLQSSMQQYLRMAAKYADQDSLLPRSFVNEKMTTSDSRWWCMVGSCLYSYKYQSEPAKKPLAYAKQYTARVEREKYTTNNHDVGFMLYCSFGNGLRLTGDTTYNEVLHTGAQSLATRYKPHIGLIRSWDWNRDQWQYPVIVDNMMNLELLLWSARHGGGEELEQISISHADKTMVNHYRSDYSCFHVVSYDTVSGQPHIKQNRQGYSDPSAWSRGQAWGLYGYSYMYRETKDPRYLAQANNIARFLLDHKNMPEDKIPYWDFDAPNIPNEPRDASAAAIMASALIELSTFVDEPLKSKYLKVVERQIRTLSSPQYLAELGTNGDFLLKHSVGSKPENSEVDVPLTYADYYYLEALTRYKRINS